MRIVRLIFFVLAVGLPLLVSKAAFAQRTDDADKKIYAQRHFEQGLSHFDAGQYVEALTTFRTSLELYPSPNTRLYMARTLSKLGEKAAAANAYEETIRSAELLESQEPRYAETAQAARAELGKFRAGLAQVQLAPASEAIVESVLINGKPRPLESLGLPTYTEPGTVHVLVVYASGTKRAFRAEASSERVTRIRVPADETHLPDEGALSPPPPDPSPSKPLVKDGGSPGLAIGVTVGAGVALVGLAGAVGFGLAAQSKYDALESECGGPCATDRSGDIETGKTYDALTNVGIVTTAVGVAATTLFLVLLMGGDETAQDESLALTPDGIRVRW